jgi:hypothetical protein
MSEVKDAFGQLAKDVRFAFPLIGAILFVLVLITFEHLGPYQQLAPILAIYTLFANLLSWLHTTATWILLEGKFSERRVWGGKIVICVLVLLLQSGLIAGAICLMHDKHLI